MLRLLMVVTGFPLPDTPAIGVFNLRTARALSASCDVCVVRLRTWRPFRRVAQCDTVDGMPIWTIAVPQVPVLKRASIELYKRTSWMLVKHILKDRDVIHSVGVSFAGLVASHWSKRSGVRHVTQVTSLVEVDGTRLLPAREEMRFTHGVACNSNALAARFKRAFPQARNVRTIYRGVDLQHFAPTPSAYEPVDGRAGVRFLFLGGFPDYRDLPSGRNTKGGETLLDAWQAAENDLAQSGAQLVVGGPYSDEPAVKRWRDRLLYPQRVQIVGTVAPDSVKEYLNGSDVVLVPSLQEGFPNIALEASACGRGLLASAIDPIAELVVDGENGKLVPPGDTAAWQRALVDLARRREDVHMFGEQARHRAEQFFDAAGYPGQLISLYEAAVAEELEEPV